MAGVKGFQGVEYDEVDYINMINVASFKNWIDYSTVSLVDSGSSSEHKVIKKQSYDRLSKEAKEIISTVLECPLPFVLFVRTDSSFSDCLKRKEVFDNYRVKKLNSKTMTKRLSNLKLIQLFFQWKWEKEAKEVEGAIQEITEFCEVF